MKLEVGVKVNAPPAVLGRPRLYFEHGGQLSIAHVLQALPDLLQRGVVLLEQPDRLEPEQMCRAIGGADAAAVSGRKQPLRDVIADRARRESRFRLEVGHGVAVRLRRLGPDRGASHWQRATPLPRHARPACSRLRRSSPAIAGSAISVVAHRISMRRLGTSGSTIRLVRMLTVPLSLSV